MEGLFLLLCILQIGIQIFSLNKLKKTKEKKFWNQFIGISVASFIVDFIAYATFAENALGLGDAVACVMVCGISFVANLILFIIGLIIKIFMKDKSIKLGKRFIGVCLVVVAINVMCIIVIPTVLHNIKINRGEKFVINYLDKKYGDGDFDVVNVYNMYENYGMWDKYLAGYYYEIKTDYMDATFIVTVDDNIRSIVEDYFLPVYFSKEYNLSYQLNYDEEWHEDLESDFKGFDNLVYSIMETEHSVYEKKIGAHNIYLNYVESWSSTSGVEYDWNYFIVPSDNGKIPTLYKVVASTVKMYKK